MWMKQLVITLLLMPLVTLAGINCFLTALLTDKAFFIISSEQRLTKVITNNRITSGHKNISNTTLQPVSNSGSCDAIHSLYTCSTKYRFTQITNVLTSTR